jgi:hypothetical protein
MKKAERIRKLVTRISAGVLFTALLIVNLQIGLVGNNNQNYSLSDLTFGLIAPAHAAYAKDGSCCPYDGAICGLNGVNYGDRDYNSGSCGGGNIIPIVHK